MKKQNLHIALSVVIALGLFSLIGILTRHRQDYSELFTGYDDRISFIVEGYQMHWDGFAPEDLDLSYIYKYESPYGGFVKFDLDGDGTEELLLGDQFENGDYQIYDIFTFDRTTGEIIHLFCGGERNWCTLNGSGVIIETGSNSAEDSFTNCYVLKKLKMKKLGKRQPVTQDLLVPDMDKFINYAHDDGTENSPGYCFITVYQPLQGEPVISGIKDENGGPEMKVIIDNEGNVGRYVGENENSYRGETQDSYWVEKDKAKTEMMKACEGQGILTRCLGYIKGWFLADIDGKSGLIQENLVNWDAINTF